MTDIVSLLDRMSVSTDQFFLEEAAAEIAAAGDGVATMIADRYPSATPEARTLLLRTLERTGDDAVVPALVAAWDTEPLDELRRAIEWTVACLGAHAEAAALATRGLETCTEDEFAVRVRMGLLADLGDASVLPALERTAGDDPGLSSQVEVARLRLEKGFPAIAAEHRAPSRDYDSDAIAFQVYNSLPRPEVLQVMKEDLQASDPSLVLNAAMQFEQGTFPEEWVDDEVKTTLLDLIEHDVGIDARLVFLGALVSVIAPGDDAHVARLRRFAEDKPYVSKLKVWRRREEDALGAALTHALQVMARRTSA